MKSKIIRYTFLSIFIIGVLVAQYSPELAAFYALNVYPFISLLLSSFSNLFPFSIGDFFIFLSITGIMVYPFYARYKKHTCWKKIFLHIAEYLTWMYVWFYLAWGINYFQPNFYQRTKIQYTAYTPENFQSFIDDYIAQLNTSYTSLHNVNHDVVRKEIVKGFMQSDVVPGIHRPTVHPPKVKTMLFTPIASKVGVTGSMAPFFNEFTINGDLLPVDYPATYAHEYAHLLGISNEAEANFYAYQVCTHSNMTAIRFSGYFSILNHVLSNAFRLLDKEKYTALLQRIRPEVIQLAQNNQTYWRDKYSPLIGNVQRFIYDIYLKGNNIPSGRKNYSEVIGLLISFRNRKHIHTKSNLSCNSSLNNRQS